MLCDTLDRDASGTVDYREFLCLVNIVEAPEMRIRKRLKLWYDIYESTSVMEGVTVSELLRLLTISSLDNADHVEVVNLAIRCMATVLQVSEASVPAAAVSNSDGPRSKKLPPDINSLKDVNFHTMKQLQPPNLPFSVAVKSKCRELGAVTITTSSFDRFFRC